MTAPALPDGARAWTTRHTRPDVYAHPDAWPAGPWDHEPDKVSWTDPDTGRPCLIVRGPMGALCGYVAVDPGHPLHGADRDTPDVAVHGGLTFADACQHTDDEAVGVCHVPEPGAPDDVWWFGFDCGHAWDEQPGMVALGLTYGEAAYRTVGYVRGECEALARQLTEGAGR